MIKKNSRQQNYSVWETTYTASYLDGSARFGTCRTPAFTPLLTLTCGVTRHACCSSFLMVTRPTHVPDAHLPACVCIAAFCSCTSRRKRFLRRSPHLVHDGRSGPCEANEVLRALPRAQQTDGRVGRGRPGDQATIGGQSAR